MPITQGRSRGARDLERAARNREKLAEVYPPFAEKVRAILSDLEGIGRQPMIIRSWQSPEEREATPAACSANQDYSLHQVTGVIGQPEALAVDIVDEGHPDEAHAMFALQLAYAAFAHGCETGIVDGLPAEAVAAIQDAVGRGDWAAEVTPGRSPGHVQPAGFTVAEARAGRRPK
ncbi:MAG: hypothetical protein HZB25_08095 [Candidatus Eisenbacteria bacterium]|nr:hypothetical protein [Candidatus Eisenbacteria bacterium]